jgi:PPM family protein phosphatase
MSTAPFRTRETLPDSAGGEAAVSTDRLSTAREATPRPPEEPTVLEAGAVSVPGPERAVNQDAFVVAADLGLVAVADGMGGRPAGELAARLAVTEIHRFFGDVDPRRTPPMAWDVTHGLAAGLLARAVEQANRVVYHHGLSDASRRGMGAAVAALLVAGPRVAVAHAGDVRVYRLRGGGLEKLTEDHTQAEQYAQWRGSSADPATLRQLRRVLTHAVGALPTLRVTVRVEPLAPGDTFLVCSDGVWSSLTHDAMARRLAGAAGLPEAAGSLAHAALEAGAADDVTAVLVRPVRGG